MFKKNEMFKTAILTGLILFATIGLFTIVLAPGGMNSAQALRRQMPTGGGIAAAGPTLNNNEACACDDYY
jgi:hypothetical protein